MLGTLNRAMTTLAYCNNTRNMDKADDKYYVLLYRQDTNHINGGYDGREVRGPPSTSDVSDGIESLSLSSHSSNDTTSNRSEDVQKASPAATVLRPRFGKEYQKLDRRTLSDIQSESQRTPVSPSSDSSVFTFEMTSSGSPSRLSYLSQGNDSPNSPDFRGNRGSRDHAYVNVPMARTRDRSSYMNVDMTPPNTPPKHSVLNSTCSPPPMEQINPRLNYYELDFSPGRSKEIPVPVTPSVSSSSSTNGSYYNSATLSSSPNVAYSQVEHLGSQPKESKLLHKKGKKVQRAVSSCSDSSTDYAQIDLTATLAASKAGKEHSQMREEMKKKMAGGLNQERKGSSVLGRDRKGSMTS